MTDPAYCGRCGESLRDRNHDGCTAARTLEPPRYCPSCRRRLKVQVLPSAWVAICVEHGAIGP
jgi:hypothetical protein